MGHSASDVWRYTPKQISAFIFIAGKRLNRQSAHDLSIGLSATRGEPKAVKKQIRLLGKSE